MQSFKAISASLLAILIVGVLGYWALRTLEPGNIHAEREKNRTLEERNKELEEEVANLRDQLALLAPPEPAPEENQEVGLEETPLPPSAPSKYQTLINDLQKLADDKVYMKIGSKGTRVGTVQTFLNIYFNTKKRIDNDYGKNMKTDVANFQKAVGLPADGEAGPATYLKMIDWLTKDS